MLCPLVFCLDPCVERDKNTDLKSREGVIQSFSHHHSFVRRTLYTHISAHEKKKRRRQEQQQEEERTTTTTRYGRIVGALAAPSGDDDEFDEKR